MKTLYYVGIILVFLLISFIMVWINFGKIQDLQSDTVNSMLYITDTYTPALVNTSESTLYRLNTEVHNLDKVKEYSGTFKITFIKPPNVAGTEFFITDDRHNTLSDKYTKSFINNNILQIPFQTVALSSHLYLKYTTAETGIVIQTIDVTLPK